MHPAHASEPPPTTDAARAVVRHIAATLAYRAAKVLRDVPPEFARATSALRRDDPFKSWLTWATSWRGRSRSREANRSGRPADGDDWNVEVDRFFDGLSSLDRELAGDASFTGSIEKLIQGPLADALTHVGQLAMLRGMTGAAIRPESYARAEIVTGRVGREQAPPGREFEGDASVPSSWSELHATNATSRVR